MQVQARGKRDSRMPTNTAKASPAGGAAPSRQQQSVIMQHVGGRALTDARKHGKVEAGQPAQHHHQDEQGDVEGQQALDPALLRVGQSPGQLGWEPTWCMGEG